MDCTDIKNCATQTSTTLFYHDLNFKFSENNEKANSISTDSLSDSMLNNYSSFNPSNPKLDVDKDNEFQVHNRSLVNIYLSKSKEKQDVQQITLKNKCDQLRRSVFLLQSSPFKRMVDESSMNMKSQSYVENMRYVETYDDEPSEYDGPDDPGFCKASRITKRTNQTNGMLRNVQYEKWDFQRRQNLYSSFTNKSFMKPTISSLNKNTLYKIKSLTSIVAPVRRGRTQSTLKFQIPYSDKISSDSELSSKQCFLLSKRNSQTNMLIEEKQTEAEETKAVSRNCVLFSQ